MSTTTSRSASTTAASRTPTEHRTVRGARQARQRAVRPHPQDR